MRYDSISNPQSIGSRSRVSCPYRSCCLMMKSYLSRLRHIHYLPSIGLVCFASFKTKACIQTGTARRPRFCALHGIAYFFKQWGEWRRPTCSPQWSAASARVRLTSQATFRQAMLALTKASRRSSKPSPAGRYTTVAWVGKTHTGALLDGREHKAFPQVRA